MAIKKLTKIFTPGYAFVDTVKEDGVLCRETLMNCISDDIKFADDEFPHSLEQLISKGDQRRQRPILEKASWL